MSLLNTIYAKMIMAREQEMARKREEQAAAQAQEQKAAQFSLDVSRHVEDTKQKEFWRQAQLASREGKAAGVLGMDAPTGYSDPAVGESAALGHLEGQAEGSTGKRALELLKHQQKLEQMRTGHGYRLDQIGTVFDEKGGLQDDQQAFLGPEWEKNRAAAERRARIVAAGTNGRSALDRSFREKKALADQFMAKAKNLGPLGRMTDPKNAARFDALAQEAQLDAIDPSMTREAFVAKWGGLLQDDPAPGPAEPADPNIVDPNRVTVEDLK